MEIARGEFLDSERVEDGDDDDEFEVQEAVGDLMISRSNLYALPPPLKHEDMAKNYKRKLKTEEN